MEFEKKDDKIRSIEIRGIELTGKIIGIKGKPKGAVRLKTWKERIMAATGGRNARGDFLWYSHKGVIEAIEMHEGIDLKDSGGMLSPYLIGLVKGGFMVRAVKPHSLSRKVQRTSTPEYLYRQSGKPFERGIGKLESSRNILAKSYIKAHEAHELWRMYKQLPKWYRDMMMN